MPRALNEFFVSFICFCKLIFKEPARKMFARSRWLFKGIDNGDIKELFLGSSLSLTSKNDFWHRVRGAQKSFF